MIVKYFRSVFCSLLTFFKKGYCDQIEFRFASVRSIDCFSFTRKHHNNPLQRSLSLFLKDVDSHFLETTYEASLTPSSGLAMEKSW